MLQPTTNHHFRFQIPYTPLNERLHCGFSNHLISKLNSVFIGDFFSSNDENLDRKLLSHSQIAAAYTVTWWKGPSVDSTSASTHNCCEKKQKQKKKAASSRRISGWCVWEAGTGWSLWLRSRDGPAGPCTKALYWAALTEGSSQR